MIAGRRDPGLQPERTNLSWSRTALRLILTATTLLSWAAGHGRTVILAAGVAALVGLGIYATQNHRYRRQTSGVAAGSVAPSAGAVVTLAACAVGLGVLCSVLVVAGMVRG